MYRIHTMWNGPNNCWVHTLFSPDFLEVKRIYSASRTIPEHLCSLKRQINSQWFASKLQRKSA